MKNKDRLDELLDFEIAMRNDIAKLALKKRIDADLILLAMALSILVFLMLDYEGNKSKAVEKMSKIVNEAIRLLSLGKIVDHRE